ncbi:MULTISPECIES: hypothetical protein [Streptomyces]|uniref:Uncharacterized protein n=1 Tax=Streptomyces tsukubensis (strain DSM 42081 / NBRC 108919 / NRRL 18488 / 9993) TaxID=1114943 RepID=I2N171_STRT9|nr:MULTISPECIES: hypothetical protein [Streptomyces]AZK94933.1 hypothetical protein B7R87_14450 [Streptomyces tsukubensis]EIF90768.1 hypothetical protein [Streptomyces tsukubensis NRRL18488]MYS64834.1 hypothetical protein [Streptomyces sp. SID5473]QKM68990.1 hypothetical protein STSU_019320 [Streptomyces tsukubensis NRRL18488]TAI40794.1 hypothetical protein EWI31_30920 [Streptomyces tsukubensis]
MTEPQPHDPQPAPPRDRRVLRAVGRWSAATVLCLGLGAGTASGITSLDRGELPGLATESDGRWEYPGLSLPALPEGTPRPFSKQNEDGIHHADLRKLLLPAPKGARQDPKLSGGWTTPQRFASEYVEEERADIELGLADQGLRHVAARGWSMPDGTESRVYLLRFGSAEAADDFSSVTLDATGDNSPDVTLDGTTRFQVDQDWHGTARSSVYSYLYRETESGDGPYPSRQGYVLSGDTLAVIIQKRNGGTATVPFHQTTVLQSQLLS